MANHDSNLHEFDVFLSFRGSDTRLGFTDHLYAALRRAGIHTFRDEEELERGESLNPQLEKAIRNSAASIIVFSPNYASSQWCLDELVMILERKRSSSGYYMVLPVFYHIDPCDVRHQRESFKEAFKHHVEKVNASTYDQKTQIEKLEKIEAWRIALKEAAQFSGMHITKNNGYEMAFIDEIVDDIKRKLPIILDLPKYLVGIDGQVKYINDWIRDGTSNNNILVIWGIGGIGKTTIAKYAYTSNIRDFKGGSYLEKIGEFYDKPKGLLRFQRQLLLNLCGRKEKISNGSEGIEMIKKAMCNKTPGEKYLIVLDDVTKVDQIDALLEPLNVCLNKKIIITTRDKSLLNGHQVKLHKVVCLSDNDALALFKSHAFHLDHSMEDYMKLSQEMIRRCGNLPLALKVLGSSLVNMKIDEWEETLHRLDEVADPNIQKVLKISYDSLLDDKIKKLFLRIGCLFVGKNKDFVIKVLDPCALYPKTGIKTLCDKCLITIDSTNGSIGVHQLVQDMAREIIRQQSADEPGERSILWRDEDSFHVLKENTGTKAVEGLTLDIENINKESICEALSSTSLTTQADLNADAFSSMRNLAIIKLNHVRLIGSCESFSKKLVWVQWRNYRLESVPSVLILSKLVVLDMKRSNMKRVWDGYKVLESLKILNLSYSLALERTPDFNGLPKLERLILKGCTSLATICKSIGALKGLVLLNLEDCKNLRVIPSLPDSISELTMLGCTGLGKSTMELSGVMPRWLQSLSRRWNSRMVPTVARPVTTWGFLPKNIVTLCLRGCNLSDDSFPWDGSWLSSLTDLDISKNLITQMPKFVGSLPSIESLRVDDCPNLQSLLCLPTTLTRLIAINSHSFKVLKLTPRIFKLPGRPCFFLGSTLEELVGCFKWVRKGRVEKRVLRSLGFMMPYRMVTKVLYQYGVYSMCVFDNTDRDVLGYLSWREIGSSISITVPFSNNPLKTIVGFNVSFTFTNGPFNWPPTVKVSVSNKTKDVNWIYDLEYSFFIKNYFKTRNMDLHWLSMWKCGGFLQPGDQLVATIKTSGWTVKECGIRIVYEDDLLDDDDDEEEFDHPHFQTTDKQQQQGMQNKSSNITSIFPPTRIRWSDKMLVEISDYCTPRTTSKFLTDRHFIFTQDQANAYASEHQHFDLYKSDAVSLFVKSRRSKRYVTSSELVVV